MNEPNDWKRGFRMTSPGIYIDDDAGKAHIDAREFVEATNAPDEQHKLIGLEVVRILARHIGAELHE